MSEIVSVAFHGIAVGGEAVGKVVGPEGDERVGMTAFAPFGTPGLAQDVTVEKAHKRHLEAALVNPPRPGGQGAPGENETCRHYTICGGCDLQHLPYDAQLAAKKALVEGTFKTRGLADVPVRDVVASAPWSYRKRVALHVNGIGSIGYRPRKSHDILTPKACPIADVQIQAFLKKGFKFDAILPHGGTLYLEVGDDGRLYAMLRTGMLDKEGMHKCAEALDDRVAGGVVEVAKNSEIRFGDVDLHPTLGSFSQANAEVNAKLVKAVCDKAAGAQTALDLYAGAGNFAFALAASGLGVSAVESDIALISAGRAEAQKRGVSERVQFFQQRVEKFLSGTPTPVEYLVCDPPRSGLENLAAKLTFAPRMALISCDLAAGVRDLNALKEIGWVVEEAIPFDMFPQTAHVELLSILRRE